ncbi:transcriptional regulatory protein-like protein SIN3 [Calycina marina]|uniref:Transcriptional regulatory protein-like protein SIN3 n=1 Tax=Calycina marina TaxID=1763456 RepID=A0A9P7Z6B9_9HELO|nr:transcriptional regulatory protein-like protein SIN3 [Calycina marina]
MNGQPPQAPPGFEHNEQMDEHARLRAQQQRQDLEAQRDRDREYSERQERERQQYGGPPPHQNNTGSIPLHQPVASRLPGAMHSPGGLLANHGAPPPPPTVSLGAPSGPGNVFGGFLHTEVNRTGPHGVPHTGAQIRNLAFDEPVTIGYIPGPSSAAATIAVNAAIEEQRQQRQQSEALRSLPFGASPAATHPMPGAPAIGQGGQQPILNDALSYLDQVKVQFVEQPDVYNRFLDIMKDFKSQAIDTPGVINRVSELFAGHPNLIQGFNTFLPPGYRIECGTGSDPNSIRVTTPMGTTVQSIPGRPLAESNMGSGFMNHQRPGNWQAPNHSVGSPETVFSPHVQNMPYGGQSQAAYEAQQAAVAAHQQQQRGVSQLTNAVATLGVPRGTVLTPSPGQQGMNGGQQGMEKRGPVEFNHAISYVNKIKNRFQDRPEIYKQFLEILQTYQRESKPIQDVYAQVTILFDTAPDLLEDFKQFLPESAAHAKAAAAKAAEEVAALANAQTPQSAQRAVGGMPPVGNFAPPASTGKETKKRPRGGAVNAPGNAEGPRSMLGGTKRAKISHKPNGDIQDVEPTLTPFQPVPVAPTSTSGGNLDELAFFDRVKKFISNKSTMNEFLKLCNLFSQDLVSRKVLVHKVSGFIGGSPELMRYFKDMVRWQEKPKVIDNVPKTPSGRVALSNCRSLGPSYRQLPLREKNKPCTGRDEMCKKVLNDVWASHPTWASEDSGFVAHRKNIYEESLHRIEEERHDYDFNIEANAKVIQLLEPFAQQILGLSQLDRENYQIPHGLGGASHAIYKRVLKKVYGEKGQGVCDDLFRDPCAVLPVVLARLKQKDEEWRFTQREWDKVWHAQTVAMYLKSLDHMGIQVKAADKKNFSHKHLVDLIKTKYEEQKKRSPKYGRHQFAYKLDNFDTIIDVLRFMIVHCQGGNQYNSVETRRIIEFFEKFVTTFFDIPEDFIAERISSIDLGTPDDEEEAVPVELTNGRGKKNNGKKNDLRRGVLERNRNGARGRTQKDDSANASKESTPDVESLVGEDDVMESVDEPTTAEVTNDRWTVSPFRPHAAPGTKPLNKDEAEMQYDDLHERECYGLYCNQTIYIFFYVFQTLVKRFQDVKDSEEDAEKEAERARMFKPAKDLSLIDAKNERYFEGQGTFYSRTLALVEEFINGDMEESKYHDHLRHVYLKKGWQLFTVHDHLKQLCKLGSACSSVDSKEKASELLDLFYKDRELKETSWNNEIRLRKQAEKHIKDGELFVIRWIPEKHEATIQWLQKDEPTVDQEGLPKMDSWKFYVSSYFRVDPTEGVNRSKMQRAVLSRNMRIWDTETQNGSLREALTHSEELGARICANTSKMFYDKWTTDWYIFAERPFQGTRERLKGAEEDRTEKFREKFVLNNKWMKGMTHDEVQNVTGGFKKWVDEGIIPAIAGNVDQVDYMVDDA